MKTSYSHSKWITAGLLLVCCAVLRASPLQLFERGIYTEETKGELSAAIELYRQVLGEAGADRALAAQAQLRIGLCELKLGNKAGAISELEELRKEFPDKTRLLAIMEEHMPSLLDEILKQIEQNYIQTVDRGELMETALRAIIGKLDADSAFLRANDMSFLSPQELAQMNEGIKQRIAGIGVALKADEVTGNVTVATLLPGSPAMKGGLRAGDQIIEVDDVALPVGKELQMAVQLLRGSVGTPVTTTVRRAASGEVEKVRLVRNTVHLPSVKGDQTKADGTPEFMLDTEKKIGYIRLLQVGKETPAEMSAALKELRERGIRGLILDLRNNPGGLLSEAVAVSDLFLEKGRILSVKSRTEEQTFEAKAGDDFSGFPMAVLINNRSASSAEIIAAALQDHERAVIIGERSFGQALVKSIVPLKNDLGALKLPVAAYYRPNGQNMNRYPTSKDSDDWGVTPDEGYAVAFTEEENKAYETYRAERDVVGGTEGSTARFEDRQLQKAREYLEAQLRGRQQ